MITATTLTIGALEDGVKYSDQTLAEEQVEFAERADFDGLDITTAWTPGQTKPDPGELALLRGVADATQKAGIQLLITAYAAKPRFAPTTDEEQDNYAQYMASLARSLPSVDAFAVWNEPNLNGFWLDQFDESGNDIAATAYEALLAKTYDALKAVSPKLKIYGGNLAPRGFDDADPPARRTRPRSSSRTWAPRIARAAARSRSWTSFALHPYQTRSSIPPGQPHTGTSLGIGDYDKLVSLLGEAFDGTGQQGSKLPIAYTEFGVQSIIPPSAQAPYTNLQSPLGKDAVPEETQADYYEQAFELGRLPADRGRLSTSSTCSTRPTSTAGSRARTTPTRSRNRASTRSRRRRRRHARGSSRDCS